MEAWTEREVALWASQVVGDEELASSVSGLDGAGLASAGDDVLGVYAEQRDLWLDRQPPTSGSKRRRRKHFGGNTAEAEHDPAADDHATKTEAGEIDATDSEKPTASAPARRRRKQFGNDDSSEQQRQDRFKEGQGKPNPEPSEPHRNDSVKEDGGKTEGEGRNQPPAEATPTTVDKARPKPVRPPPPRPTQERQRTHTYAGTPVSDDRHAGRSTARQQEHSRATPHSQPHRPHLAAASSKSASSPALSNRTRPDAADATDDEPTVPGEDSPTMRRHTLTNAKQKAAKFFSNVKHRASTVNLRGMLNRSKGSSESNAQRPTIEIVGAKPLGASDMAGDGAPSPTVQDKNSLPGSEAKKAQSTRRFDATQSEPEKSDKSHDLAAAQHGGGEINGKPPVPKPRRPSVAARPAKSSDGSTSSATPPHRPAVAPRTRTQSSAATTASSGASIGEAVKPKPAARPRPAPRPRPQAQTSS